MNSKLLKSTFLKKQEDLLNYIVFTLKENNYEYIRNTKHYVYAKGNLPVLLVAHCDVEIPHKQITKEIEIDYDEISKIIKVSKDHNKYLGADDRAGVYALLELSAERKYKPYLLFTTEEEILLFKGVRKFINDNLDPSNELYNKILFAIELDNVGNNKSNFYHCKNKAFKEFINDYGFSSASRVSNVITSTDVVDLSKIYNFSSANLSVGYYHPHKNNHYLNLSELESTIVKVKDILDYTDSNINNLHKFKSHKKNKRIKPIFKLKLFLNKKISLINCNNRIKYYLNKCLLLLLTLSIGGGIGLIIGIIVGAILASIF